MHFTIISINYLTTLLIFEKSQIMDSIFYENMIFLVLFLFIIQVVNTTTEVGVISDDVRVGINLKDVIGKMIFISCGDTLSKSKIEHSVKSLNGVIDAAWSKENQSLKVTYRKELLDEDAIQAHLKTNGFPNLICISQELAS